MGFSFTATAQCDACGNLLGSSDEGCSHDGRPVRIHVFRRLGEGRDSLQGVETTDQWKWYALKEETGDDWIAYQYLGTEQHLNRLLRDGERVETVDHIAMSCDAPTDVAEHEAEG